MSNRNPPVDVKRLLFVCTGNICRSPTAEGIALKMIAENGWQDRFMVDSAGTHNYHEGDAPDSRTIEHAAKRGYDLSGLRARRIDTSDFARFDYILALDFSHHRYLNAVMQSGLGHSKSRVVMLSCVSKQFTQHPVPDPYYSGPEAFEETLDMVEESLESVFSALIAGQTLPALAQH
jgi:protein-tyrosine phosphatase